MAFMKTNSMHPERFSFSEIRAMIGNIDEQKNILQIIGRDIGMLRTGHKLFAKLLRSGTPYIIEDCRLALIKKGEAKVTVNLMDYTLRKDMIAFIGSGSIIQVNSFSEDFELCGMMVGNEKMNLTFKERIPAEYKRNAYNFIATPELRDIGIIDRMFQSAWEIARQKNSPAEVVDGIIYSLLHYYDYLKNRHSSDNDYKKPHNRMMFDRFIQLVSTYSKSGHSLSFYADKMCVTPRYLGVVIKETSGITAKEWIDRALITNAKIMLKYENIPIAQIAEDLNFPNPSFFCKFFKRITGMTPHEFRQRD